jgi:hypothetical protein
MTVAWFSDHHVIPPPDRHWRQFRDSLVKRLERLVSFAVPDQREEVGMREPASWVALGLECLLALRIEAAGFSDDRYRLQLFFS